MSVREWVLTLIILALPLINIVMMLVWAFGGTGNLNRRNYCRAWLFLFAVIVGLSICVGILGAILGVFANAV